MCFEQFVVSGRSRIIAGRALGHQDEAIARSWLGRYGRSNERFSCVDCEGLEDCELSIRKIDFTKLDAKIAEDDANDVPAWITGRELGISSSAVSARALKLRGFTKRASKGVGGIQWSNEQDAYMLQAERDGLSRAAIAEAIGTASESSVSRRLRVLHGLPKIIKAPRKTMQVVEETHAEILPEPVQHKTAAQLPAQRVCLVCRKSFYSHHAGNRICNHCRQSQKEQGGGLNEVRTVW